MCCRTSVFPIVPEIALVLLEIGLFVPTYTQPGSSHPTAWMRKIEEEETCVTVTLATESLEINIGPAISAYSQHAQKRLAASICFEIAAKYAEKVDGEVIQKATVVGCRLSPVDQDYRLASYPSTHLSYDRVCPGFRELFLGQS